MKKTKDDSAMFEFKIGKNPDGKEWGVMVSCEDGVSEEEFASALISLGEDILEGRVSYDKGTDKMFVDNDSH